jgi:capsular exopolysaccharide synthesis family protein
LDPRRAPEPSVDLRDYVAVLRRQRWLVVVVAAIGLGAALGYSLASRPVYSARAEVLVRPISLNPLDSGIDDLSLETEREVVLSTSVARIVARRLGTRASQDLLAHVEVEVPTESQVLEIVYSDPDPRRAFLGAITFAEAYLQFRTRQAVNSALRVQESIQSQIDTLETELEAINEAVAAAVPGSPEHQNAQIQRQVILGRLSVLENQQATISAPSLDPGSIIGREVPTEPSSPRFPINLAVGLFFGAFFGVVGAFIRDRLDDRIRATSDLERSARAPVLATVPYSSNAGQNGVASFDTSDPEVAEAYRRLRTSVQLLTRKGRLHVLMVASAVEQEGKTTTAANLAVSLALIGRKVVLVSGDLRRPRLHELLEVDNRTGVEGVLQGSATLAEAVQPTKIDNLLLLPSGPTPAHPGELLSSDRTGPLFKELVKSADFVIVDSPPALVVADAVSMAPQVDAVLLVAREGTTTRKGVELTRNTFQQVGARVIGTVFVNSQGSDSEYYGYSGVESTAARLSRSGRRWMRRWIPQHAPPRRSDDAPERLFPDGIESRDDLP